MVKLCLIGMFAVLAVSTTVRAKEQKTTLEKIQLDPATKAALQKPGETCNIIIMPEGNSYRVCPFKVTPSLKIQMKTLEGK